MGIALLLSRLKLQIIVLFATRQFFHSTLLGHNLTFVSCRRLAKVLELSLQPPHFVGKIRTMKLPSFILAVSYDSKAFETFTRSSELIRGVSFAIIT